MKLILFNIAFYLIFIVYSAITIPLLTLLVALFALFLPHRRTMRRFRRAISWYGMGVIRGVMFPWVQLDYRDLEPENKNGPFIIISNHRSSSDPFLMALMPWEVVQVVNIWPFRIPVLGIYARWAGYLNVNQMPFEEFAQKVIELLGQGVSIAVFPEGTRSGGKAMGQFHGSIFRVALIAKCPIVPVCIAGNENIPSRDFVMRPGRIKVHKLPALDWEDYKDMTPFKLKNWIREIMANELAVMEGV